MTSADTATGNWVTACRLDDIEPEGAVRFDHGGGTFAIFRSLEDEVFCTDGLCTHERVHLADGLVMDYEIECPKHAGAFDYRTGEAVRMPPCVSLRTYETRVRGGTVEVRLEARP
jgi:3-phenylpropionate/trans-cinnamate dioxygenase ferredoxin subunit